ncbi:MULTISPECIES: YggT family protein [Neobacillus]|uniref:YggT family protein n=2 Tax=Neobacillus TaxID=2675232 RepID=A0A942U3T4_9BACI|nr:MULTISPECIES: YggT family protein [Neobacillus]MBS4211923.1 YggT family protein [Neobacillus rhizophilus]MBU8915355.1 YggT family protein [Bacillus sp. FJAT-29953]MCH6268356.1 YggT family protein [Neobacillus citreus]
MFFVIGLIQKLIWAYSWALIIYILMSWFPGAKESAIGQFLARICEPYLEPFRRIIPAIGMIDISPIVAFLVLNFATRGLSYVAVWLS